MKNKNVLVKELKEYASKFEELMKPTDSGTITPSSRPSRPPATTQSTIAILTQDRMPSDNEDDGYSSNQSGKKATGTKLIFDTEHSSVKKAGGQRVDREKFSIDETKSFVSTGGYPSSNVK
jgi:hypothetical protein